MTYVHERVRARFPELIVDDGRGGVTHELPTGTRLTKALRDAGFDLKLGTREPERILRYLPVRLDGDSSYLTSAAMRRSTTVSAGATRYADDPLALDKWFALQAQLPGEGALARVQGLEADPAFTLKNPNRARALLGTFASGNPTGFHRADGAGYRLYAERLLALDALNPQIAARLATAFNGWQRLEPQRREAARASLAALAAHDQLSRNLAEIVGNMLKA